MTTEVKMRQGTAEWFEMVGTIMSEAASRAGLSPKLNVSFVETCTDGIELSEGLVQGLRFHIIAGKPSFRVGARRDEHADATITVTSAAARKLNLLYSTDPNFEAAFDHFASTGEIRIDGDLSRMSAAIEHRLCSKKGIRGYRLRAWAWRSHHRDRGPN